MSENLNNNSTPSASQIQAELKRIRSKREYGKMLRGTIFTLVAVAAVAVLISVLFLPVLDVYKRQGVGSVIPLSVPASFAVNPERK